VPSFIFSQQQLRGHNVNLYFISAINIQRMGLKMEYISGNMKNMQNNQQIMGSFQKMATIVGNTMNVDFESMANNMQNL
jgi:hypothetical protein